MYNEILPILEQVLEDKFETVANDFEFEATYNEAEHKSMSGFIPYTNGGFVGQGFTYLGYLNSSGKRFSDQKANTILDDSVENLYNMAKEQFLSNNPDLDSDVDYNSLYEDGQGDLAEELSEIESEYLYEESVMLELGIYYYNPSNDKNPHVGEEGFYVYSVINFESPYHRNISKWESYKESSFYIKDISELKSKLNTHLDKVLEIF